MFICSKLLFFLSKFIFCLACILSLSAWYMMSDCLLQSVCLCIVCLFCIVSLFVCYILFVLYTLVYDVCRVQFVSLVQSVLIFSSGQNLVINFLLTSRCLINLNLCTIMNAQSHFKNQLLKTLIYEILRGRSPVLKISPFRKCLINRNVEVSQLTWVDPSLALTNV